ncbi:hypothetical protein [Nocardiopsis suaedae]|uniref:DUF6199 domain-containing protein n=1 Tax=Nocardiopsis suaedae TaxID=3018444 RepID=A0ABT4TSU1_9ACTN|nr:hypothetical protein [Nocardiopsis suaedae]MDA2807765.1 hypothetical protein [Nocardiopsis suaedae]
MPEGFAALTTVLAVLLGLLALFNAVQAVHPRLTWELSKWRYRDPAAVEPSRAVFRLRRVAAVVRFALFLAAAVLVAGIG